MCNHARAIVNDAFYSVGISNPPKTKEEARALAGTDEVTKRLKLFEANTDFHMHVRRLLRFPDEQNRNYTGKCGPNGAKEILDAFLQGMTIRDGGCPGWMTSWSWEELSKKLEATAQSS